MSTHHRRGPKIRSRSEAESATFAAWGKQKSTKPRTLAQIDTDAYRAAGCQPGRGALSWRPWSPKDARRQGQGELMLPLTVHQLVREQIERAQTVPRQARIPKGTKRRSPVPQLPE